MTMNPEEQLVFLAPDDIRVKGTRIGVETVYYDYIHRSKTAEEIAATYPSLDLEKVYAALYYYHTHREEMDRYIADWLARGREAREHQAKDPRCQRLAQKLAKLRQTAEAG